MQHALNVNLEVRCICRFDRKIAARHLKIERRAVLGVKLRRGVLTMLLLAIASPVWGERQFMVRPGQRQLFFDDVGVANIKNLARTMHRREKKGVVIRVQPNLSGPEMPAIQATTPPIWDPDQKIWKCWTNAPRGVAKHALHAGGTAYWESDDGLHWRRPIVGQVQYAGSRQNNFISFEFQGKFYRPRAVVYVATVSYRWMPTSRAVIS